MVSVADDEKKDLGASFREFRISKVELRVTVESMVTWGFKAWKGGERSNKSSFYEQTLLFEV